MAYTDCAGTTNGLIENYNNNENHHQKHFFKEPIMNRKITLNGGNELRIDDKNISLHLNNPFVTTYTSQTDYSSTISSDCHQQQFPSSNKFIISCSGGVGGGGDSNGIKKNQNLIGNNNEELDHLYNDHNGRQPRRPHSITVSSSAPLNNAYNDNSNTSTIHTKKTNLIVSQSSKDANSKTNRQENEPAYAHLYEKFKDGTTNMQPHNIQEFALYTPPIPITAIHQQQSRSQQQQQQQPPNIIQRRSHSTPRPVHNLQMQVPVAMPNTGGTPNTLAQRPRSLDRGDNNLMESNYKPPIPTRRMSQSSVINQKPILTNTTRPISMGGGGGGVSNMRQSITYHGQLNRQTMNYNFPVETGIDGGDPKRKNLNRPLSYAYGTLPDQIFLENQLRIYSEQLKNITESVRKYSEQAKLLSEMKKQQQQHILKQSPSAKSQSSPGGVSIVKSESLKSFQSLKGTSINGSGGGGGGLQNANANEPQTPSHQLKLFLDNIRSSIKDPSTAAVDELNNVPDLDLQNSHHIRPPLLANNADIPNGMGYGSTTAAAPCIPSSSNSTVNTGEAKTPSDQLRQFLDAIRSNQVPDDDELLKSSSTDRFAKFRDKIENVVVGVVPPTTNSDKFRQSSSANDSFSQISDNLRIMNKDLEDLTVKCSNNTIGPATKNPTVELNSSYLNKSMSSDAVIRTEKQIMNFNRILDNFQNMTGENGGHSIETVNYLRKCSEALRGTSDQFSIASVNYNGYNDSPDGSSCSTTPGSIREAVQNLLAQPRNGVQIMDDRMKLFIDILDSQEKFSQVRLPMLLLYTMII